MTTQTYEGDTHIYYSNNNPVGGEINLTAPEGQTLVVHGTLDGTVINGAQGIDQSVQFNSLGDFAGDSDFLYDTINTTLTVPIAEIPTVTNTELKGDVIKALVNSDDLDHNEIYSGSGSIKTIGPAAAPADLNFGSDLAIATTTNTFVSACPDYAPGASTGGVAVYDEVGNVYSQTGSILSFSNFTLEANIDCCTMEQAGEYLAFIDNNENLYYCYLYQNVLGTWTYLNESFDNVNGVGHHQVKMSNVSGQPDIYLISIDIYQKINIYTIDRTTGAFTFLQTLLDNGPTLYNGYTPIGIHGNYCYLKDRTGNDHLIYKFNSTTLVYELEHILTITSSVDAKILQSGSDSYFLVSCSDKLVLYKNGVSVLNVSGSFTNSCISPSLYVFAYDQSLLAIRIFHNSGGTWVESTNNTQLAAADEMVCNNNFLICSNISSNIASYFNIITPYVSSDVTVSQINLKQSPSNNLAVSTLFGSQITGGLDVDSVTSSVYRAPLGDQYTPPYSFTGQTDTGMYLAGTSLCFSSAGDIALTFDNTHIVPYYPVRTLGSGTVTEPSFSFINSQDTGLYNVADSLLVAANGTCAANFTEQGSGVASVSIGYDCATNTSNSAAGTNLKIKSEVTAKPCAELTVLTGATEYIKFYATSSFMGDITTNGSQVFYNTTSDYRLKENVQLLDTANELSLMSLVRPSSFNFKSTGQSAKGFIAHELQELFPGSVNGEKDGEKLQSIDASKLVVSLVACVQELNKQVNLLKEEIKLIKEEMATFE